jgi:16S rRNA (guanine1516-N2)-methyltransferase
MDKKRGKPFHVDFLSAAWKARFQTPLGRNHIFRRALGIKDEPLHLIDATAGFGQDSLLAASLGCKVTAVERSKAVAALLKDGIERATREDVQLRLKLAKVEIVNADAVEYLTGKTPDVVYIDPMFEKPKKSAKSPKEMQLLQELLESAPGEEIRLFEAAMTAARARVVIKRPLKARAHKTPSHSFKGQSIRYDVYVK